MPPSKKRTDRVQAQFNVSRRLDKIIDPKTSRYRRAVILFEFQIAILACNGLGQSTTTDHRLVIRVDREVKRSATALATLQLLQHISAKTSEDTASRMKKTEQLLGDRNAIKLISDIVFGGSGLSRVRHALTPAEFMNEIEQKTKEVACVNAITDFSVKFAAADPVSKNTNRRISKNGNINHALEVLFEDNGGEGTPAFQVYGVDHKVDSAKKFGPPRRPVCALLWLASDPEYRDLCTPPPLNKKSFAKKLLRQAGQYEKLCAMAADHELVTDLLASRGYEYSPLALRAELEKSKRVFEPLDPIITALI